MGTDICRRSSQAAYAGRNGDILRVLSSATEQRPRLRSRTRDLAERRLSLVKLLVALFVARMVVTVVEVTGQRLGFWTILVTLAMSVREQPRPAS